MCQVEVGVGGALLCAAPRPVSYADFQAGPDSLRPPLLHTGPRSKIDCHAPPSRWPSLQKIAPTQPLDLPQPSARRPAGPVNSHQTLDRSRVLWTSVDLCVPDAVPSPNVPSRPTTARRLSIVDQSYFHETENV